MEPTPGLTKNAANVAGQAGLTGLARARSSICGPGTSGAAWSNPDWSPRLLIVSLTAPPV
jgi:hypothetical protein